MVDESLPPYLSLPAPDRALSGRTGWTRAHWEAVADHLLDAVAPHLVPGTGQVRQPGRASVSGVESDGLEGFARTLLLAAFRIAGACGVGTEALAERYAAGLAAGTDPASPARWPAIVDTSQQMVEAASRCTCIRCCGRGWPGRRRNTAGSGRTGSGCASSLRGMHTSSAPEARRSIRDGH